MCLLEGLRKTKTKPSSYCKLSAIFEEKNKDHSDFLDSLLEALIKHMSIDPDSIEGQIFIKDMCITQSTPNIRTNYKR